MLLPEEEAPARSGAGTLMAPLSVAVYTRSLSQDALSTLLVLGVVSICNGVTGYVAVLSNQIPFIAYEGGEDWP